MKLWTLSLALAAVCLVPLATRADDERVGRVQVTSDTDFLTKAISSGVTEVKLGQMAEKNASNADVKAFGSKMANDHKKANEKLLEHARSLKVGVVTGLDKETRETASRLGKLEGRDFDREYMDQMVKDHENAVSLFESYSKSATNKELGDYARETLPKVREHLKEAKTIRDNLKR